MPAVTLKQPVGFPARFVKATELPATVFDQAGAVKLVFLLAANGFVPKVYVLVAIVAEPKSSVYTDCPQTLTVKQNITAASANERNLNTIVFIFKTIKCLKR